MAKENDTVHKLLVEMQLFSFFSFIVWCICGLILYKQQVKWKKKRKKDDMFLDLEQDDEGDSQYLVSFFTGSHYKHAPSGNVTLQLIGSKYPGKFHCLTIPPSPSSAVTRRPSKTTTKGGYDGNGTTGTTPTPMMVDNEQEASDEDEESDEDDDNNDDDEESTVTKIMYKQRKSPQKDKKKKQFSKNCREKFIITEDVSLGQILRIVLHTEVRGKYRSWECESVIVRDINTNQAWLFKPPQNCNKISWPPIICEPVTVEELTSFKWSWKRRVRREVRNGQYVFFGFWFRPITSVYKFGERIGVALTCYFFLFSICFLFLELVFAPNNEIAQRSKTSSSSSSSNDNGADGGGGGSGGNSTTGYSNKIATRRPVVDRLNKIEINSNLSLDAEYWLAHVAVIGLLGSVATSVLGYILVSLFRQKSKYETRVEEMDYVIGTALQEFNRMNEMDAKISANTGDRGDESLNNSAVIGSKGLQEDKDQASSSQQPQEGNTTFTTAVQSNTSYLPTTNPKQENKSLFHEFYHKFTDTFKSKQATAGGEDARRTSSSDEPKSKPKKFSLAWHDFTTYNPFAKKKLSSSAPASGSNENTHNANRNQSSVFSKFNHLFNKKVDNSATTGNNTVNETTPLILVTGTDGTAASSSMSPTSFSPNMNNSANSSNFTTAMSSPAVPVLVPVYPKRSTIFEPNTRHLETTHELSAFEQREEMRKLFEGWHHNLAKRRRQLLSRMGLTPPPAAAETVTSKEVADGSGSTSTARASSPIMTPRSAASTVTEATLHNFKQKLDAMDKAELAIGMNLDENARDLVPKRKFPQPIFGWFVILLATILPTAAISIWIIPEMAGTVFHIQINKVMSTFIAALYIEIFVIETMKIAILGAYYAWTDKTIYKRLLHETSSDSRIFSIGKKRKSFADTATIKSEEGQGKSQTKLDLD